MTIKRLKRFVSPGTRKRLNQYRKQESPRIKLQRLWHQDKKKLNIKSLLYIVQKIEYDLLQKDAIIEFLDRKNLNFDHFYRMSNVAKDILKDNKKLNDQFWKACFNICNEDNLLELSEIEIGEAIKELFRRIETSSNRKALQVLIRFFERKTDPEIRMVLWKKIKERDPSIEDLKYLLVLPSMYALPKITSEIEKLLKRKDRKTDGKILQKIERTVQQIKNGQK